MRSGEEASVGRQQKVYLFSLYFYPLIMFHVSWQSLDQLEGHQFQHRVWITGALQFASSSEVDDTIDVSMSASTSLHFT